MESWAVARRAVTYERALRSLHGSQLWVVIVVGCLPSPAVPDRRKKRIPLCRKLRTRFVFLEYASSKLNIGVGADLLQTGSGRHRRRLHWFRRPFTSQTDSNNTAISARWTDVRAGTALYCAELALSKLLPLPSFSSQSTSSCFLPLYHLLPRTNASHYLHLTLETGARGGKMPAEA
jgi:hypothetical protein